MLAELVAVLAAATEAVDFIIAPADVALEAAEVEGVVLVVLGAELVAAAVEDVVVVLTAVVAVVVVAAVVFCAALVAVCCATVGAVVAEKPTFAAKLQMLKANKVK